MKHIQCLVRQGNVVCHNKHQVSNCEIPKCAACLFGKITRRPTEATTTKRKPDNQGNIKKVHLKPGKCISADQYVCMESGKLYNSRGMTHIHENTMVVLFLLITAVV